MPPCLYLENEGDDDDASVANYSVASQINEIMISIPVKGCINEPHC